MDLMSFSDECYRVFSSVFGSDVSKEKFYHKHFQNPNRLDKPLRTCIKDGKIVGINAFMGISIIDNTGEETVCHSASQSNDTAVLNEYRGQHIFTEIVKEEINAKQTEYIIGIPNDKSYPGFLKMGWTDVCEFTNYALFFNPFKLIMGSNKLSKALGGVYKKLFLHKRLPKNNAANFDVEISDALQLTEKEWGKVNEEFRVGVARSQEYINWKLYENGTDPKCMIFREHGVMVGYIIFHIAERWRGLSARIDDFCIKSGYSIWNQVYDILLDKTDMIENPFVNRYSKDVEILKLAGMKNYKRKARNKPITRMIVSPDGKGSTYLKELQMRMIDFDIFLNK